MAEDFLNSAGFGIIVGALSAFAATFFSNQHSNRQQLAAQKHERQLQRDEQEFECKRTALTRVAEATVNHHMNIATAFDKPISELSQGPVALEFATAHTGLHLYVSIETIEASNQLVREFGLVVFAVMKARMPMELCDADINLLRGQVSNIKSVIEQRQSEIEVMLQDQKGNGPAIANAYRSKSVMWNDIANLEGRIAALSEDKYKHRMAGLALLTEQIITIVPSMTRLLVVARGELGMTLDEQRYTAGLQQNVNAARDAMTGMFKFVEEAVQARIEINAKSTAVR